MNEELYVTIEEGGPIGVNANWGHYRVVGNKAYKDKEAAKKQTKEMSKRWGGGYYGYKYSTKTLAWALKNNNKINLNEIEII